MIAISHTIILRQLLEQYVALQARLFRAVAELYARESHVEEELSPELLQREKSLIALENVIVTWDPRSDFIA